MTNSLLNFAESLDNIKWNADGLIPVITQQFKTNDVLMLAWMNREALQATIDRRQAVYWSRSRQALWHKGETSGHWQNVIDIRIDCDNDCLLLFVEQIGDIACHTGRHSCFYRQLSDQTTTHDQDNKPSERTTARSDWQAFSWQAIDHAVNEIGENKELVTADNLPTPDNQILQSLAAIIEKRKNTESENSYVAALFKKGEDAILKKIGEEATEVVMAAKDCSAAENTLTENSLSQIKAGVRADEAPPTAAANYVNQRKVSEHQDALVAEVADLWFHCLLVLAKHHRSPQHVLDELQKRAGLSGIEEKALRKLQQRELNEAIEKIKDS